MKKNIRIMFVIPTLGTGGAERVASILANSFSKKKDVGIFVMEQSRIEKYPIDNNVNIKEAKLDVRRGNKMLAIYSFIYNFIKLRKLLYKEIKIFHPDIVISFLPKADLLTASLVSKLNFCWIASERNDPLSRNSIEKKILENIYKKTSFLVCQTKKVSEHYKKKGVMNVCVIRNPLIINGITDPKFHIDYKYVISVGRLDKQKNYKMLIKAFANVKKDKKIKEKLLILGEGLEEKVLKNLINDLKMDNEIFLVGRKKNVIDYLKQATLFIMSSDYEGLPNAMLEAMAVGLPIISTDYRTGAAREFIDNTNGAIVPVGNHFEMSTALKKMLSKESYELAHMGEVSKKRVSLLDETTISNQWEELIERCINHE